jgi:hypothetical protein
MLLEKKDKNFIQTISNIDMCILACEKHMF